MLNRHFYRAKTLQSLYAYQVSESSNLLDGEKKLIESIEKLENIHVYLLSSILEIHSIAEEQIEAAKLKYFPTEEEKNPNLKFLNNAIIAQLKNNVELKSKIKRLKISWHDHRDILIDIYNKFKNSEIFKSYMSEEEEYDVDKKIIIQLLKNHIIRNEQLYDILCENELEWETYYEIIAYHLILFIKDFTQEDTILKALPKIFDKKNEEGQNENDKDLMKKLFRKTIQESDFMEELIKKRIQNWEIERIAILDIIIIKMGIVELMYCPDIPIRVTLNEYIELAKEFSTEKSRIFVNGVLDKLIAELRVMGKLRKIDDENQIDI